MEDNNDDREDVVDLNKWREEYQSPETSELENDKDENKDGDVINLQEKREEKEREEFYGGKRWIDS